jgi:hypothetical protein
MQVPEAHIADAIDVSRGDDEHLKRGPRNPREPLWLAEQQT